MHETASTATARQGKAATPQWQRYHHKTQASTRVPEVENQMPPTPSEVVKRHTKFTNRHTAQHTVLSQASEATQAHTTAPTARDNTGPTVGDSPLETHKRNMRKADNIKRTKTTSAPKTTKHRASTLPHREQRSTVTP
ncbi:hypothetical protein Taro_044642 [Colocasia esculenta]|uniref:Uncharacterized protein n=1 Tax=Colocasia esculenta TaxID=4460 RepID=A0A843X3L4_COLES|nr:hypothetical protein [Colocasia esculenta]